MTRRRSILLSVLCGIVLTQSAYAATGHRKLSQAYGSYLKGFIHFDRQELTESLQEFRKVKQLVPESIDVRLKIAFLLVKLEEFKEAEKELHDVKTLDPNNLDASLGLIFLYSYLKEEDKLEIEYGNFLEQAHSLRPEDIRISEYLAQFYFYKNRIDDTIRMYEAIVKSNPEYTDARYLLGYFYEKKGQRSKAISLWEKSLEYDPYHADTLNSLGYIYAEKGRNLDKAEELIQKALKQDPQNGAYLDSLGWVYYKKQDFKKAQDYLKRAIENVADPIIYEHMGDTQIKLGNIESAVEYYKQGLALDPNNSSIKKKLQEYGKENKVSEEKSKPD